MGELDWAKMKLPKSDLAMLPLGRKKNLLMVQMVGREDLDPTALLVEDVKHHCDSGSVVQLLRRQQ